MYDAIVRFKITTLSLYYDDAKQNRDTICDLVFNIMRYYFLNSTTYPLFSAEIL